jgi:hypothetical protein
MIARLVTDIQNRLFGVSAPEDFDRLLSTDTVLLIVTGFPGQQTGGRCLVRMGAGSADRFANRL